MEYANYQFSYRQNSGLRTRKAALMQHSLQRLETSLSAEEEAFLGLRGQVA